MRSLVVAVALLGIAVCGSLSPEHGGGDGRPSNPAVAARYHLRQRTTRFYERALQQPIGVQRSKTG